MKLYIIINKTDKIKQHHLHGYSIMDSADGIYIKAIHAFTRYKHAKEYLNRIDGDGTLIIKTINLEEK